MDNFTGTKSLKIISDTVAGVSNLRQESTLYLFIEQNGSSRVLVIDDTPNNSLEETLYSDQDDQLSSSVLEQKGLALRSAKIQQLQQMYHQIINEESNLHQQYIYRLNELKNLQHSSYKRPITLPSHCSFLRLSIMDLVVQQAGSKAFKGLTSSSRIFFIFHLHSQAIKTSSFTIKQLQQGGTAKKAGLSTNNFIEFNTYFIR